MVCASRGAFAIALVCACALLACQNYARRASTRLQIIQTWKTAAVPEGYLGYQARVLALPGARYRFYDDDALAAFVRRRFPQYYGAFVGLPYAIQRIDMFRYLAVYALGGLYLDLDMEVLASRVDASRWGECCFPKEYLSNTDPVLRQRGCPFLLGNYAFFARRRHPFLKELVDNIVTDRYGFQKRTDMPRDKYVFYTTGPVHVTLSYLDTAESVTVLAPEPFRHSCFGDFAVHRQMGSWKT